MRMISWRRKREKGKARETKKKGEDITGKIKKRRKKGEKGKKGKVDKENKLEKK